MKTSVLYSLSVLSLLIISCAPSGKHWEDNNPQNLANKPKPIGVFQVGFEEDILPLIERNCALCHSAGPLNWKEYNNFVIRLSLIQTRVFEKKDMPPQGPMSAKEELILQQWLKDGGPQNRVTKAEPPPAPPQDSPILPEPPDTLPENPLPIEPEPPIPAPTLISFAQDVKPILENRCSLCHNANTGLGNWLDYSIAKAKIDRILYRAFVVREMPPGASLDNDPSNDPTSEEERIIRQWLADGLRP